MKLFGSILAGAVALAFTTWLHAASTAGKTQQLNSPDQVPEGLVKSEWQTIRAAYEAGRHAFAPTANGWQARNPGQQWTMTFDQRGFVAKPRDGGWQWGLELKSYGFQGAERVVGGVPTVEASGPRLTYDWDATVQEWFVNDARGLEHGFTVKQRPANRERGSSGRESAPSESGEKLEPTDVGCYSSRVQSADRDSGNSHHEPGRATAPQRSSVLSFLLATRGTLLPRVSADARGVAFQDASGVTVLTYAGLKVWDADGKSLPSRFELAGSQLSTPNSQPHLRLLIDEHGARYPLTIDPIAQQAYLKAHQVNASDYFGHRVAISGDTVVLGAYGEDSGTTGANSTPDESAQDSGAAYVFVRNGTNWTQQAYLKAHQVNAGEWFGRSVAVSGDIVVVGAQYENSSTTGVNSTPDENAPQAGAAYVFVRSGTNWAQQAYLKAHQVDAADWFGRSVAVSGNTVVVGATREDSSTTGVNGTPDESARDSGAAYVFVRSGTNWTQQAYLKAHQVYGIEQFGFSVAISGDTLVVGDYLEDSSTTGVNSTPDRSATDAGAAYVFVRSGTNWTQQAYLKAHQVNEGDFFGISVAVSDDTVVVGANLEDSSTTGVNSTPDEIGGVSFNSGAAYVFVRSGTNWTQQAYLKAHQVTLNDHFGDSVGISGDTVVVGASGEDSGTTAVNSTPEESASSSGAAYVFVRSGTNWTQQAYLKAHQVNAVDIFGYSVAVSGDTVVVGAVLEDGSTTGVNSTPNESATDAGAAYVFTGLGPPLSVARITSVNPFQFQFDGGGRPAFEVEFSTNLTNWAFIGQATNLGGNLFQFNDSGVTNFSSRFYRLKVP
jgi:hypothetical protein